MPIKRIAFACSWGCARNVITSKKRMATHEKTCFSNPDRRACKTCKKYSTEEDSNGMENEPDHLEKWVNINCDSEHDISEKLKYDCFDHVLKV